MKKLITLLIIVLSFSCTPKKIITATKTEQATIIQNAISDTQASAKQEAVTKVEQSDTGEEITVKTTVYVEKKDEAGKQLIKSETVTTKKKIEKKEIVIDSNKAEVKLITHADSTKTTVQTKTETKVKEIPKAPAIKYWLYLFGFIAVTILVVRYWSVIKTFLKL